jgi:hypothetical protein
MQKKPGSSSYARMERYIYADGLTDNEIDFIAHMIVLYSKHW